MKLVLDKNQEKNIEFGPNSELEVVLFKESNIGQKQSNHSNAKGDCSPDVDINKKFLKSFFDVRFFTRIKALLISHRPADLLSVKEASTANIPSEILVVNSQSFALRFLVPTKIRNAAPNQPADRLTKRSDIVNSQTGSIRSNWATLTEVQSHVN